MSNPEKGKALPSRQSAGDAVVASPLSDDSAGYDPALSRLVQHLLQQELTTADRVGRMLHDRLGPALAAVRMHIDLLKPVAAVPSDTDRSAEIDAIDALLDGAISGVRQMMEELHLPSLAGRGLATALEHEIIRQEAAGNAVDLLLETDESLRQMRWPTNVEVGAFMIAREAMDIAVRHAGASLIRVVLTGSAERIDLQVLDDGCGVSSSQAGAPNVSLGITAMRERARAMEAQFSLSAAADGGTSVTLHWEAK